MTRAEQIEAAARAYLETFDAADALDPLHPSFTMEAIAVAACEVDERMKALRAALALPEDE